MRRVKICLVCMLGLFVLVGCAAPSKDTGVASVKSQSKKPQPSSITTKTPSIALVTDITRQTVPEKPGVTRVILTLDKKASYSTSREGSQLVVNVFSAKMTSSIKQIEVQDPVITSITAKQIGNSVKGIIALVNPDIAYTPSTSTDPFQIRVDIWQLSPKAAVKQPSEEKEQAPVPAPVQAIEVDTSEQRTKELTLDIRKTPEEQPEPVLPATQDVPAQLQWFSEKLSQVLQEREALKQQLLDAEKDFAVKDSMIQVLEKKVKEANARIVELEEELIKARSKMSLVEQNEKAMETQLQQLLTQLEVATGEEPTAEDSSGQIQNRSKNILAKLSALQSELEALNSRMTSLTKERKDATAEIEELQAQIATLTTERDELQTQARTCTAEVEALRASTSKLAAIEKELRVKEVELSRLRQAIGAAAQLVTGAPAPVKPVQPEVTVSPGEESQILTQPVEGVEVSETPSDETQLVLENLIQQQQLLPVEPEDYVLGPEDVIQIKVLKEENLDKTVTVSPDGFITYPLLGDLRVDGLTTAQVDAQITSLLARDFLVDPEVMVEIVKQRSKKAYIMGLVKQPGYHEITEDQRLLNTLLSAGGPASFDTEVRILRLPKGEIVSDEATETLSPIVVDLHKLFVEGDQTQNIVLHDGDVLMIAEKAAVPSITGETEGSESQFYVVGSVVNPGVYNYQPNDTILDAILRAGGFTEFASRNSTKLVRESDGKTRTFRIKMKDVMEKGEMDKNMAIMPGDMIIVPESFF